MIVEVNGQDIKILEMTVGDVRRWASTLQEASDKPVDLIGETLFEDITLAEIELFADMKQPLDKIKLEDLRKVGEAIKTANPCWVSARAKVLEIGNKILEQNQAAKLKG